MKRDRGGGAVGNRNTREARRRWGQRHPSVTPATAAGCAAPIVEIAARARTAEAESVREPGPDARTSRRRRMFRGVVRRTYGMGGEHHVRRMRKRTMEKGKVRSERGGHCNEWSALGRRDRERLGGEGGRTTSRGRVSRCRGRVRGPGGGRCSSCSDDGRKGAAAFPAFASSSGAADAHRCDRRAGVFAHGREPRRERERAVPRHLGRGTRAGGSRIRSRGREDGWPHNTIRLVLSGRVRTMIVRDRPSPGTCAPRTPCERCWRRSPCRRRRRSPGERCRARGPSQDPRRGE